MRIEQSVRIPIVDVRLRIKYRIDDGFDWSVDW